MTDNLVDSLMEARRGIAHTMCARRLRECPSGSRWWRLTAAEPPPASAAAGLAVQLGNVVTCESHGFQ